jgi:hypothetical protein
MVKYATGLRLRTAETGRAEPIRLWAMQTVI